MGSTNSRCLAVMYHYVRDRDDTADRDIRGLGVASFTRQLDDLCSLLTPIDWQTFVAWRAGRIRFRGDAMLLTFDDGLSDHAEVVRPILEARGLRGVFFVHTQVLVRAAMSPAHQLHLLLCRLSPRACREAMRRWMDDHAIEAPDACDDDARAETTYHYETPDRAQIKYLLTHVLPFDVSAPLLDDLFAEHVGSSPEYAQQWYMGWDDLNALQKAGHTIGGHGHRHLPYARLSPLDQTRDLARCASVLREGLGVGERPFSYPYGSWDEDVARRCAAAGFVNGFTTREGWIEASQDAHRLRRVDTIHVDAMIEREFVCLPA